MPHARKAEGLYFYELPRPIAADTLLVVAAAPVASESGWERVRDAADKVVCPVISSTYPFSVASFYDEWYDLTDDEVVQDLEEFKIKRGRPSHD